MTITEMIKALEAIREAEGDIRVTIYDEYTACEGWGYKNEDLWTDATPEVETVIYDYKDKTEKVVCICAS